MSKLVRLLFVLAILGGGWWYDHQRAKTHSALSGFFESQPTQVSSQVQGRIKRILVQEGDTVSLNQVLLELDAAPYGLETRASLGTAEQIRQQLLESRRGTRPEEIRKQEAVVAEMQANLEKLRQGNRPEEIEQARAAERNARAKYDQSLRGLTQEERSELKARVEYARSEEVVTRMDVQRYQTLWAQAAASRQQLDRKVADADRAAAQRRDAEEAYLRAMRGTPKEELEQARTAWQQAQASLELSLKGSRSQDIRMAEARLEQAQAELEELRNGSTREQLAQRQAAALSARASAESRQANLRDRNLRAPIAGLVDRIPVSPGDLVSAGTTLVRLVDPQDIWLRVYVPEDRLAQAAVKGPAEIRLDGIPQPLAAHVESVSSRAEFKPANLQSPEERARQVYGVRLRLNGPDPRVKAGMFANVVRLGEWTP